MKIDLALKFGSHEIIIYRKGFGIIAKEPAYLAVTPVGKRMIVKAVGKSAEKLKATKSNNILVYQPIKNSEVVDVKLATTLIRKILEQKIVDKFTIGKISALVAVPCAMTVDQLAKLKTVLMQGGIDQVTFVQNGVCVRAYDESVDEFLNCAVVDVGKYTTDISVLNKFTFHAGRDYFVGGADMDTALQTYILDNYNLEVTLPTAEDVKSKIASLYENDMYSTEFSGLNSEKLTETKTITANEVRVAIQGVYDKIFDLLKQYLDTLPKDLSAEVYKNGVIFSGGSCKLQGMYEYASKKLDMPVISLDNPVDAVVLGLARLLDVPTKSLVKIEV